MSCKGLCDRYKAKKPAGSIGRYASGQKRCLECCEYMLVSSFTCPCCNMRLRTKPRNLKYKIKYAEAIKENGKITYGIDYEALRKQDELNDPLSIPLELPLDEIAWNIIVMSKLFLNMLMKKLLIFMQKLKIWRS